MKLIIASDIHGSYKYTKKLCELIDSKNPDKIILLGDILYHGARNELPLEYSTMDVANILNGYASKIVSVRGNCDSEVDDMVTLFDLTSDYQEVEVDGKIFFCTHGHLLNKYSYLTNDKYIFSGHTHVYQLGDKHYNPGSVGIPKVNPEHTCFYYENGTIYLINLDNFSIIQEKELK